MAATAAASLLQGSKVRDEVVRVANTKTPLLAAIPAIVCKNSTGPLWNVEAGTGTITTHAEAAVYPAESDSSSYQATLGMGRNHSKILISDEAITRARLYGNPGAIRNLKSRKTGQRVTDMLKWLQNQAFNGAGGANQIAGFGLAISDSGTYAGVVRSGQATFQSTVMSANPTTPGTGFALTKARLRTFISTMTEKSNLQQEELLLACTESVWNVILGLYEGQVSYNSQRMLGGVRPMVTFDGLSFVRVPAADAVHSTDSGTKKSLWAFKVDWENPELGLHWEYMPYVEGEGEKDGKVVIDDLPYGIQVVKSPESSHATGLVPRNMIQLVNPNPIDSGVLNDILI